MLNDSALVIHYRDMLFLFCFDDFPLLSSIGGNDAQNRMVIQVTNGCGYKCCRRQTRNEPSARVDLSIMKQLGRTGPATQLKPSKWPLRILSPIGEGALRGLPPPSTLRVAERLGLVPRGVTRGILAPLALGLTAVFGGVAGRGGDGMRAPFGGFASALPRESLLSRPVPLESGMTGVCWCWLKRPAVAVLARRACAATGTSVSVSSSSKTGGRPENRLKGNVAVLVGD